MFSSPLRVFILTAVVLGFGGRDLLANPSDVNVARGEAKGIPADRDRIRSVKADRVVQEVAQLAGLEEQDVSAALLSASGQISGPGGTKWIKAGAKVLKFVGSAKGPAGVVVHVHAFSSETAAIQEKRERGELTREQAEIELAKVGVRTAVTVGGPIIGQAVCTLLCPGPGTVIGGFVGGLVSEAAAEFMAANGLDEKLAQFLVDKRQAARISTFVGMAQTCLKLAVVTTQVEMVVEAESAFLGSRNYVKLSVPVRLRYEVDLTHLREDDFAYDESSKTLTVRMPSLQLEEPNPDREAAQILEATKGKRRTEASVWELRDWLLNQPLKPQARSIGEDGLESVRETGKTTLQTHLQKMYAPVVPGITVELK